MRRRSAEIESRKRVWIRQQPFCVWQASIGKLFKQWGDPLRVVVDNVHTGSCWRDAVGGHNCRSQNWFTYKGATHCLAVIASRTRSMYAR